MCTAVCFKEKEFYFGRTFDYESSYGEEIVVLPRNFEIDFRHEGKVDLGYAMIGIAHVSGGYPLFYDAANERGLCMAGLNFVENAKYNSVKSGMKNAAQYEFLPWVLRQCGCVAEAKALLENTNITDLPFGKNFPSSELHWLVGDKNGAITVESVADGLKIYDNPVGVLTNNPPFDMQLFGLNDYAGLSPVQPENKFSDEIDFKLYSRGMGAVGLPGDWSSRSRFVRAAFVRANSFGGETEEERVNRMFHVLGSVNQVKGCCDVGGKYEYTIYTSCINADKGIYYHKTYNKNRITGVNMYNENLDGTELVRYPVLSSDSFVFLN